MKAITDIHDPRLVKGLAHPLRVQILSLLQDRVASPSDLAGELGAPLGNVSYHVRILAKLGLIKLVRKQPRRGAIEHMYEADGRVRVSDRAWRQVPSIVKEAMIGASLERAVQYVEQALVSGGFERGESHLSRQPMRLDKQGWRELSAAVTELLERANEIEKECQERDGRLLDAGLVMMLFDTSKVASGELPADDPADAAKHRRTSSGSGARSGARQRSPA